MEDKVYCKDCRYVIVNRTELFGEIRETKCGKVVEYESNAFDKKPKRESMEQMNGFNNCPYYIHIADIFGKSREDKQIEMEDKIIKRERILEHIKNYTLKDDWNELMEIGKRNVLRYIFGVK
jgi:hypothetical protein